MTVLSSLTHGFHGISGIHGNHFGAGGGAVITLGIVAVLGGGTGVIGIITAANNFIALKPVLVSSLCKKSMFRVLFSGGISLGWNSQQKRRTEDT